VIESGFAKDRNAPLRWKSDVSFLPEIPNETSSAEIKQKIARNAEKWILWTNENFRDFKSPKCETSTGEKAGRQRNRMK
jgi:hypothetical protein